MKKVYIRRRLMLATLILLPIIVTVFFVTRPAAVPKTTTAPTKIASVEIADNRCTGNQIATLITSDRNSYARNQLPAFRASVRNVSASPCRLNVGTASQSYRIIQNGQLIWDSKICLVDPVNALVTLGPNQTLTGQTLTWHRELSDESDCGKDFAIRPKATPGEYTIEVSVDGFSSPKYKFVLQ